MALDTIIESSEIKSYRLNPDRKRTAEIKSVGTSTKAAYSLSVEVELEPKRMYRNLCVHVDEQAMLTLSDFLLGQKEINIDDPLWKGKKVSVYLVGRGPSLEIKGVEVEIRRSAIITKAKK